MKTAAREGCYPIARTLFYGVRFTSQVGQALFFPALLLIAGGAADPATSMTGVLAAMAAAAILLGFLGGSFADSLGLGRALAWGARLRLAVVIATFFLGQSVGYVWALAFAYSAVSQLFSPAELALVATVEPGRARRGHAFLLALQYGGQGLGFLILTPLLYLLGGAQALLIGAAFVYGMAALLATAVAWYVAQITAAVRGSGRTFACIRTVRFLATEPRATYATGLLTFVEIAAKSLAIAMPIFLREDLGIGPHTAVAFAAAGAVGFCVGLFWSGYRLLPGHAPNVMRLVLVTATVCVLAFVGFAGGFGMMGSPAAATLAFGLPAMALLGCCCSVASGSARAVLSDLAPVGHQARVFATQATLTDLLVIGPVLLSGFATDMAGGRMGLVLIGAIGLGMLLFLERAVVASWRRRRSHQPVEADGQASSASSGNHEQALHPPRLDIPLREPVVALSD